MFDISVSLKGTLMLLVVWLVAIYHQQYLVVGCLSGCCFICCAYACTPSQLSLGLHTANENLISAKTELAEVLLETAITPTPEEQLQLDNIDRSF
jgi:hypothetical protein